MLTPGDLKLGNQVGQNSPICLSYPEAWEGKPGKDRQWAEAAGPCLAWNSVILLDQWRLPKQWHWGRRKHQAQKVKEFTSTDIICGREVTVIRNCPPCAEFFPCSCHRGDSACWGWRQKEIREWLRATLCPSSISWILSWLRAPSILCLVFKMALQVDCAPRNIPQRWSRSLTPEACWIGDLGLWNRMSGVREPRTETDLNAYCLCDLGWITFLFLFPSFPICNVNELEGIAIVPSWSLGETVQCPQWTAEIIQSNKLDICSFNIHSFLW